VELAVSRDDGGGKGYLLGLELLESLGQVAYHD
jgi:hypothetical protein